MREIIINKNFNKYGRISTTEINCNHIISFEINEGEPISYKDFDFDLTGIYDKVGDLSLNQTTKEIDGRFIIKKDNSNYTKPFVKITTSNNIQYHKFCNSIEECKLYINEIKRKIGKKDDPFILFQ